VARRELGRERRLGGHGLIEAEDLVVDEPAARVALLAVGPGRHPEVRPTTGPVALVGALVAEAACAAGHLLERAADGDDGGPELLIDAVVLERTLLGVRDPARQQQATGRQREHRDQQPRPQRGHHVRGWRSA
jgi:hypothetical protein